MLALLPAENRLDQILVAPDRKGGGIGAAMLDRAKSMLTARIVLTTHETNHRARTFYERESFRLLRMEVDPTQRRVRCTYVWEPAGGA